ncbi:MAG: STAS domain-containing protein [Mycobacteriales bacterium]
MRTPQSRDTRAVLPSVKPEPPAPRTADAVWLAFSARDRATVHVEGEVDIATSPQLVTAMHEALAAGRDLTVDLSGATFFGASGLNAIAKALHEAESLGRSLRVINACNTTERLFALTGLDRLLRARQWGGSVALPAAREEVVAEGS